MIAITILPSLIPIFFAILFFQMGLIHLVNNNIIGGCIFTFISSLEVLISFIYLYIEFTNEVKKEILIAIPPKEGK